MIKKVRVVTTMARRSWAKFVMNITLTQGDVTRQDGSFAGFGSGGDVNFIFPGIERHSEGEAAAFVQGNKLAIYRNCGFRVGAAGNEKIGIRNDDFVLGLGKGETGGAGEKMVLISQIDAEKSKNKNDQGDDGSFGGPKTDQDCWLGHAAGDDPAELVFDKVTTKNG